MYLKSSTMFKSLRKASLGSEYRISMTTLETASFKNSLAVAASITVFFQVHFEAC